MCSYIYLHKQFHSRVFFNNCAVLRWQSIGLQIAHEVPYIEQFDLVLANRVDRTIISMSVSTPVLFSLFAILPLFLLLSSADVLTVWPFSSLFCGSSPPED